MNKKWKPPDTKPCPKHLLITQKEREELDRWDRIYDAPTSSPQPYQKTWGKPET